jgi:hypothetical protein
MGIGRVKFEELRVEIFTVTGLRIVDLTLQINRVNMKR